MGKWSNLKDKFAKFVQEPEYQQKVSVEKAVLTARGFTPQAWADNIEVLRAVLDSMVDNTDQSLDPVTVPDRAAWFKAMVVAKQIKDLAEDIEKVVNLRLEALDQILVDNLEGEDESKIVNSLGTFSLVDSPYPKVADKPAFLGWVRETDQEEILSVNYQTMAAIVKAKIEKGEELPAGVEVFIKTTVRWTRPRA